VQRGRGAGRSGLSPEQLDQLVARNHVIEPQHQAGEENALLAAADGELLPS
jgi:hypothetical protein